MKNWIKKIFGFGLASLFGDLSHEMTVSLIPILVGQFVGLDKAPLFLGIISSVSDAFASFLRLISGFLTDRLPRKKPLIMIGYGIAALFTTLTGFAQSIWGILIYRILSFTGSGLREPPRDALIATITEPAEYGRAFGLRNAMDTIGALIGPFITLICIGIVSIRTIFALSFIPGILSVFAILFLTQDIPVYKKSKQIPPTFWHDFSLLPRSFIIFLVIMFIFDVGLFNRLLLLSRTQDMLSLNKEYTIKLLVLLYALFNITRACSEFIIGFLSDYINRLFLFALFGCGTFAAVGLLLTKSHASFTYCAVIFVLAGLSTAAMTTLKKACAADMLPANIRGLGYGTLQASEGFASLISSAFIGFLWTYYPPFIGGLYVTILCLISMVLLLIFGAVQKYAKRT